jgi:hypothetical protein
MEQTAACDLGGQPILLQLRRTGLSLQLLSKTGGTKIWAMASVTASFLGDCGHCGRHAGLSAPSTSRNMTKVADIAEDQSLEFVDINEAGELSSACRIYIVVADKTALSVISLRAASTLRTLMPPTNNRRDFNESQVGRLREPDAVQWIDDTHFAIANEG